MVSLVRRVQEVSRDRQAWTGSGVQRASQVRMGKMESQAHQASKDSQGHQELLVHLVKQDHREKRVHLVR